MWCYGEDDGDRVVKNSVKGKGTEESRVEEKAQSSPLTHESQLLSPLYQSASFRICPHGPVLVHHLERTYAHRCYRLLKLSIP
jgi:hypothetical protein